MQENKSIEELENDFWPIENYPTTLVERCHHYRKIPLKDLSVEQMRTLIDQRIGLAYVLPKALRALKSNILAEGDCYPGDLIAAVLSLDSKIWDQFPHIKSEVSSLISTHRPFIEEQDTDNEFRQLLKQIDYFLELNAIE